MKLAFFDLQIMCGLWIWIFHKNPHNQNSTLRIGITVFIDEKIGHFGFHIADSDADCHSCI